jgi:hypothetical protein
MIRPKVLAEALQCLGSNVEEPVRYLRPVINGVIHARVPRTRFTLCGEIAPHSSGTYACGDPLTCPKCRAKISGVEL